MSTKRQISIPDELWTEAKVAAAKEGVTATEIVNAALTQWLAKFHDGPTREEILTPISGWVDPKESPMTQVMPTAELREGGGERLPHQREYSSRPFTPVPKTTKKK